MFDSLTSPASRRAWLARSAGALLAGLGSPLLSQAQSEPLARMRRISEDMQRPHDFPLHGVQAKSGWHVGPFVVMGAEPYGRALPKWWRQGLRFDEWRSVAGWFTVYLDARGSPATNTGVEIDGLEVWVLQRSTRRWVALRAQRQPAWQGAYHPNATDSLRKSGGRMPKDDSGFVAIPTTDSMVHGGAKQVELPWSNDGADMLALLVSIRHRLVTIDTQLPDDRSRARMGVIAGADYYPWVGAGLADLQAKYNPGAGSGRLIQSTPDWNYSTVLLRVPALTAEELLQLPPPAFTY
ncbi:hypothetical protein [Paucibacter sp. M5-1]|uniref:hypothetical protein n=1 Tax=Paucibacter sp. M5-1 TaxID=3015998 RepID=UPI0022B90F73|nr:hypothetical protein [Paucibacter sp. M5-1]MCZ7879466.1 hypothetical protein [Paucibacter sp. M5-1]